MARVVGKEGTLNAGVVFDIQDIPEDMAGKENLGGEYDNYDEMDPADDPAKTEFQVANALVRGDYTFNPSIDPVEKEKLDALDEDAAREIVHAGPDAAAGASSAKARSRSSAKVEEKKE